MNLELKARGARVMAVMAEMDEGAAEESGEGVCLDGSTPGFYYSPAPAGSAHNNSWVLYLQGGAWCTDKDACLVRSRTELGSSTGWNETLPKTAMKSGMLAAESIAAAIAAGSEHTELMDYDAAVRDSWIADELKKVKNAQPAVAKWGEDLGTVIAGIDMWMRTLKIGLPFTLKHTPDYTHTKRANNFLALIAQGRYEVVAGHEYESVLDGHDIVT